MHRFKSFLKNHDLKMDGSLWWSCLWDLINVAPGGVSETFAISISRVPADIGPISSVSTHGG